MAEGNNEKNNKSSIVTYFCVTLIVALVCIMAYFGYATKVFNDSQNKIIQEHTNHIANVDSVFFEMKKIILSSDSGTISNAPELLSQLQRDSALFRREVLLSLEEMSNLTELHLNRLDSNFDLIGVWFGVASVIFLVFGFFGIFKIEENKREAEKMTSEVKIEAETVITDIQGKAESLKNNINDMSQQATSFYSKKEQEFNKSLKKNQDRFDLLDKQMNDKMDRWSGIIDKFISKLENLERQRAELEKILKKYNNSSDDNKNIGS